MAMKLITFQSMDALKALVNCGSLRCDEKRINRERMEPAYQWVVQKMNGLVENPQDIKYPLWCWVKCYHHICPPKRRGNPVEGFDVKITFHKQRRDVFITDYRRYSFVLNNLYISDSRADKELFDEALEKYNISADELRAYMRPDPQAGHRTDEGFLEICRRIRDSFDRCITEDSNILQGCVWEIALSEVEKIEILSDKSYCCGSLNYIRSNGKRIDWQKDFHKTLKELR